jgi:hypothetical protein
LLSDAWGKTVSIALQPFVFTFPCCFSGHAGQPLLLLARSMPKNREVGEICRGMAGRHQGVMRNCLETIKKNNKLFS